MSQDSYVFLKTELFPHDAWREILNIFLAEEREQSGARTHWVTSDPTVRLSVQEIGARHAKFGQYRWQIGIHCSGPYDVMKLWVTVAVPYHCLLLLKGAIYQGPEPDGGPVIEEVAAFKCYAENLLISRSSLQKVVKHGVMDGEGNLILDASHNKPLQTTALRNAARER